jgi:hypothetical protein
LLVGSASLVRRELKDTENSKATYQEGKTDMIMKVRRV